jgi:repressor of nif and glnA expression
LSDKPIENLAYDLERSDLGLSYISSRFDELSFRSTFCPDMMSGKVAVNRTVFSFNQVRAAAAVAKRIIYAGLGMGRFSGWRFIDGGRFEFCTVCGAALDAVLRRKGIPVVAQFGGLLEIVDHKPFRFTQIIRYDATTIDPLEVFIRGGLTRVYDVALSGTGVIGAAFREIPTTCLPAATAIISHMERIGLTTTIALGKPNRPVLDIPVSSGKVGLVISAGLNVAAALEENEITADSRALAGLKEFSSLLPMDTKIDPHLFKKLGTSPGFSVPAEEEDRGVEEERKRKIPI